MSNGNGQMVRFFKNLLNISQELFHFLGDSMSFSNWCPGQPSGDGNFVAILHLGCGSGFSGFQFNDRPDTDTEFICETRVAS